LATDGQDALEKFSKDSFDLVVTDFDMPKMNGMSLIRNIRKTEQKTTIRAITACPVECVETYGPEAIEALNFQLYAKPLSFEDIVEILES
jgi:CheY-like chemotaxis protein